MQPKKASVVPCRGKVGTLAREMITGKIPMNQKSLETFFKENNIINLKNKEGILSSLSQCFEKNIKDMKEFSSSIPGEDVERLARQFINFKNQASYKNYARKENISKKHVVDEKKFESTVTRATKMARPMQDKPSVPADPCKGDIDLITTSMLLSEGIMNNELFDTILSEVGITTPREKKDAIPLIERCVEKKAREVKEIFKALDVGNLKELADKLMKTK